MSWIWGSGFSVIDNLGPGEYAGLVTLFTGALIVVNYSWIQSRSPKAKFMALEDQISVVIENLEHSQYFPSAKAEFKLLERQLKELGISMPNNIDDIVALSNFLADLLVYCREGRIKEARWINDS